MTDFLLICLLALGVAIHKQLKNISAHIKPITTHTLIIEAAFKAAGKAYEARGKADGTHIVRQEDFCNELVERAVFSGTLPNMSLEMARDRFRSIGNFYLWVMRDYYEKSRVHADVDRKTYLEKVDNSSKSKERRQHG